MIKLYLILISLINGINPIITHSIVKIESNFKVNALGDRGKSYGLFQIKCTTAREIGFRGKCSELFDPIINMHYGILYLSKHLERYSVMDSISAYNAGKPYICKKIKNKCKNRKYINNKYVKKVLLAMNTTNIYDVLD